MTAAVGRKGTFVLSEYVMFKMGDVFLLCLKV